MFGRIDSVRREEGQAQAAGGISDGERLRRDVLRDNGARRNYRPRANGYSGRDYGSMRDPDVVADAEGAARPLAPVGQSHHRGNHATLANGDRLVSLDGGVVEVRAISYSDFGSGVTDEFGGNRPSNKSNPVSQPDCAFILDAHGTISVDTSASFTVSEKDCATNEGYDAAKRMAGISLKALEEAPHKMRVGLYGRSSAFPLPGGSGAGGGSSANDRATGDNAAAAHSCAGQNDYATFESDSGFDDNRNRLRLLHPFAQLMKAVVEDLASFSDLASVADLRGQESLNRCAALDLDVIAQDHFGARANVEFDRRAGGIEADSVPDPERSATVDPDPACNRRRRA